MLVYNWYAQKRNWTPQQVDELSLEQVEWLPLLSEALEEAQEVLQKQDEAQNRQR